MNVSTRGLALKTRVFDLHENLFDFILEEFSQAKLKPSDLESKVLAVTSKIVSLSEGRVVPKDAFSKEDLVKKESDHFFGAIGYGCFLTIKHGLFIPSAGIDESNSSTGGYILFPEDPKKSAWSLRDLIKNHFQLKNFGVLLTDSHTSPLRMGVTGIALSHAGFKSVDNYIGQADLFGRELKMTRVNVADSLACLAVYCMGESSECRPLALLEAPVQFTEDRTDDCSIPPAEDLYAPLYRGLHGYAHD